MKIKKVIGLLFIALFLISCSHNAKSERGKIQNYSIEFDSDGGSLVLTQKVAWGECLTEPGAPYKQGYSFLGWYDGDSKYYFSQAVTKKFSLTAKWSANSYRIVFDKNGAVDNSSSMSRLSCVYDQEYTLPANTFTSTGSTFLGWATTKDGEPVYEDGQTVKNLTSVNGEIVTLYAVWREKEYHKIIYMNLNNSQDNAENPRKYLESQRVSIQSPAEWPGYVFVGWYLTEDFTGNPTTGWAAGDYTQDITLYAKWTPLSYTITLNDRGNKTEYSLYTGERVPNYSIPDVSDSVFGGFYSEPYAKGIQYINASGIGIVDFEAAKDITLYAFWEYKITYIIDDPDNIGYLNQNASTYTGETRTELLPLTLRNGYRFFGWLDSNGNDVISIPRGSIGPKTFTSKGYEKIVYSIVYEKNDGNWDTDFTPTTYFTVESDDILLPEDTDIKKDGFDFAGWYTTPNFTGQKILTVPKGTFQNITLYAKWVEK